MLLDTSEGQVEPRNLLTINNVRCWLVDYLELRAEETSRFPDQASSNHWDLIAADDDSTADAHFLAAFFASDQVSFLAGRGRIADIRAFALNEFPQNPDDVLDDISRRFATCERWRVRLDDLLKWLQN